MRVLVVEDEPKISALIKDVLDADGMVAEVVDNGEVAWEMGGTEAYSAVVLDIGLPDLDGISVLRRWRKEGVNVPVLLLSAKSSWNERVEGIDAGADDYLTKPFQVEELTARLRALVRRHNDQKSVVLAAGALQLDLKQSRVSVANRPVSVTPLEYRLLKYLMHNRNAVIDQHTLAENIYFRDQEPDSNAVEAIVARLRRKIGNDVIQTRRGFGYVIPGGSE